MDNGPVQAHLADDLFFRHWDFWKDGKRRHIFSLNLEREELINLTRGQYEAPRFDLGGADGYDISPDGKYIVYVSNPDPEPQSSTNGDLWMVPVTGGTPQNLTSQNLAFDGNPKFSPDGRYIAYLKQTTPGYEADLFQLALYDTQRQTHSVLTQGYNNWISDFVWSPDSDKIYFYGPREGYYPIFEITIQSENIRPIQEKVYTRGLDISPDGSTLYLGNTMVDQPTELYSVNIERQTLAKLTDFNLDLQGEVDFRQAEPTWVMSDDGTRIHLFIVKPHGFDPAKKYPLILNVHGGPQGMYGNSFRGDYQVYPGAGYVVAFSNPRGSVGYGQDFTAEISGDWGGQVFRDLMAVTDYLETLPYVDTDRMGAMGWSYGGYMMNWFEGHTDRFKALASMMGVYDLRSFYSSTEELWFPEWDLQGQPWNSDLYNKWSPSNYVANFQTPCLVITGKLDFRVPYSQSIMLFNDLQVMDVPSRLIVFENDGHWPSFLKSMPLYYNAHLEWFHEYLGGMPAPYDSRDMWRNQILNWDQ
jgi:dipeptidyl aminopeptidase/acylaminoacyl peptidase